TSAGTRARHRRRLPELTARGSDVLALAPPYRRREAGVQQDRLKREDPGEWRPPEPRALPVVERDQVDLGLDAAKQPHQTLGIVDRIVDVLEHDVLEEHALARGERVTLHGAHQRRENEGPVHGT